MKSIFKGALSQLDCGVPLKRILTQWNVKANPLAASGVFDFKPTDHLYIGNLPVKCSAEDVEQLVASILGRRPNRVILRQLSPNIPKHCFAWLRDQSEAQQCIDKLDGFKFRGQFLKANFAAKNAAAEMRRTGDNFFQQHGAASESTDENDDMSSVSLDGNFYGDVFGFVPVPMPTYYGSESSKCQEHFLWPMPPPSITGVAAGMSTPTAASFMPYSRSPTMVPLPPPSPPPSFSFCRGSYAKAQHSPITPEMVFVFPPPQFEGGYKGGSGGLKTMHSASTSPHSAVDARLNFEKDGDDAALEDGAMTFERIPANLSAFEEPVAADDGGESCIYDDDEHDETRNNDDDADGAEGGGSDSTYPVNERFGFRMPEAGVDFESVYEAEVEQQVDDDEEEEVGPEEDKLEEEMVYSELQVGGIARSGGRAVDSRNSMLGPDTVAESTGEEQQQLYQMASLVEVDPPIVTYATTSADAEMQRLTNELKQILSLRI
jgi:hypothetical protein